MSLKKKLSKYLEDYFLLIKFEQNGLFVAVVLIIALLSIRTCVIHRDIDAVVDIKSFKEKLHDGESISDKSLNTNADSDLLTLSSFNPNDVSSEELFEMGLPPSVIKSIINYRKAGYQYTKADDLLKCFGVDQSLLDQLAPFVDIPPKRNVEAIPLLPKRQAFQLFEFDPNEVDRKELVEMNLPERFINGFINFRNAGAQFYSISDMQKIYSMSDEVKQAITPYLIFPKRTYAKPETRPELPDIKPAMRFSFDPNSISYDSLLLLGISNATSQTWINYRNSGKLFYSSEDLQSIYGLEEATITELKPWIQFKEIQKEVVVPEIKVRPLQPALNIELNEADQKTLELIKGIGPFFANRIIRYRDALGGFVSIAQLQEIEELPDSTFQKVNYHFTPPDASIIQTILIQTVSRRTLADHPYMDYETANRIITHREFIKRIPDLAYLLRVELLSSEQGEKMGPYLSFN